MQILTIHAIPEGFSVKQRPTVNQNVLFGIPEGIIVAAQWWSKAECTPVVPANLGGIIAGIGASSVSAVGGQWPTLEATWEVTPSQLTAIQLAAGHGLTATISLGLATMPPFQITAQVTTMALILTGFFTGRGIGDPPCG